MTNSKKIQQGFTLVELMIALVLGLLIAAAALALFISAQRSMNFQSGMSSLQQNANFGLAQIAYELRHANLNTPSEQKINNKTIGSGVVFDVSNLPLNVRAKTNADILTRQGQSLDATDSSEDARSDQITIQFVPDVRGATQFDCEGSHIVAGRTYVYRYFLAPLPAAQQIPNALPRYGIYCDAGYYTDSSDEIIGMGESSQLVVQNVDAFKIRFLVKNSSGNLRYATINQYTTLMPASVLAANFHHIGGVELGLLMTSNEAIDASDGRLNDPVQFTIAGQTVTLRDNTRNSRYLRLPVTQVVSFRNTLGAF